MNINSGSNLTHGKTLQCLILSLVLIYSAVITAEERIRLYKEEGGVPKYSGYIERQYDGSVRIYDKRGVFQGRIKNGRMYSKDGSFAGKTDVFRMDNGK